VCTLVTVYTLTHRCIPCCEPSDLPTCFRSHKMLYCVPHTAGQALFDTPGTFTWTAPAGVTSVSAVCVAGGGGAGTYIPSLGSGQPGGAAGGGGEGGGTQRCCANSSRQHRASNATWPLHVENASSRQHSKLDPQNPQASRAVMA
jgi:hypothetical protein